MPFQKQALFFVLLLFAGMSFAENYVLINSQDAHDVLSGIFYANVKELPVKFVPNSGTDPYVFADKIGTGHDILLIQASDRPISGFMETALKSKGNQVELYPSADGMATNLDLARRSGASSFIVVDSAYSDSALSVLPYAALSKSYVLLSNKGNADAIKSIVSGKKVLIFGYVDKEVADALSPMNLERIGDGEDKFQDNVLIQKKMIDEFHTNSFIAADGTILEDSMINGAMGILLIGKIIPQVTYDFVKSEVRAGNLKSVILIGNNLVMPAYDMREKIKQDFAREGQNLSFGILVKFAQALPSGNGILNLDTFTLPAYRPSLEISDMVYNRNSGRIMTTIENKGDGLAYYTLEIRIKVDGNEVRVIPASASKPVQRGESSGEETDFDMSSITEGNVTALMFLRYGASKASLDSFTSKEGPLASIEYTDNSAISIQAAKYDMETKRLLVTIKNDGNETAYAFTKLGLTLGGQNTSVSGSGTRKLEASSMYVEEIPLDLAAADLEANRNVNVTVDYGARPGFLGKKASASVPIMVESGFPVPLVIGVILIVLVIAAAAFFFLKKPPNAQTDKKTKNKA